MKRLLFFFVFCVSLASFQYSALSQTVSSGLEQVTEMDVDGLKVLVKRRPGAPTVAAGLFIRGGTRMVPVEDAGLEGFMLNVAAEGSRNYPRTVLRKELAKMGGGIGASSNYDYSVMSLGSTLGQFDKMWDIFSDISVNPTFKAEDIESVRSKLLVALEGREDDPDTHLQLEVDKTILGKTSYGSDPNGTIASIRRMTSANLLAYHKKAMVRSRLLLVLVGDLDPDKVRQMVTKSFSTLAKGAYREPAVPALDFSKATLDITKRPLQTNYVNGIFAAPPISDPDYPAMRVATSILQTRVFEEVRVKRNLSYAPDANLGTLAANTGAIYVTAVDANAAVGAMLGEIARLKSDPVSPYEMGGISGHFLTTNFLSQETNAAQVRELGKYELVGGGWRNWFDFLNRIRKVTPTDIQRVASKYMKNLRFIVVGEPASIDRKIFLPAQ